jgi:hypothetical protein
MKIVFLTSSYYPFYSAIGKCVNNLVNELKNSNEIIVVSNMTTRNLDSDIDYDGHKIVRIRTNYMHKRDDILLSNEMENASRKLKKKMMLQFLRSIGYIKALLSKETLDKNLVDLYLEALIKIGDVDLIVPTCYPFESIVASQRYKEIINKSIRIVPFMFDKFSDSPSLHRNAINKRIKLSRHLSLEEKMILDSVKVLYVDSWIEIMEGYFKTYSEKLIHVEHPLVIDYFSNLKFNIGTGDDEFIDVVYTGVIDKKIRPPHKTLKIISKMIEENNRIRFHFYILGNCAKEINKYCKKYPSNLFNYGRVESDIAISAISNCNILLSIGNTDTSLIPSKVFEYMSAGKPILHFFHSSEDRVISMLDHYGLGYCVNLKDEITISVVRKLVEYCKENKNMKINFRDVEEKFYKASPKFIANLLLSGLDKVSNRSSL